MRVKTWLTIVITAGIVFAPGPARLETWSPPAYVQALNSGARDLEPWISQDSKTLYFSSDRAGSLDIYVSHLVNGTWSAPARLPAPLNDPQARDGHPSLVQDGRFLYFHSNRPSPYNRGGYGWRDCDIWMSENISGQWQNPVVLGPGINSNMMDYAPSISTDGQMMMFASDRPGGQGRHDIYYSRRDSSEWQPARNIGPVINNGSDQVHPSLSYTGRYLFFSDLSNIFRSELVNGVWQTPVRIPSPVNGCGAGTESSIYNDCTQTLYFYNMCGESGTWDIATSQWMDSPDDNPCEKKITPNTEWMVRAGEPDPEGENSASLALLFVPPLLFGLYLRRTWR